jgi:hypothetical protein
MSGQQTPQGGEGPADDLLRRVAAEQASGRSTSLADWLADHPPSPSAFTQTLAGVARRTLEGEPFLHAVREFIDEFRLRPAGMMSEALLEAPPGTGDVHHDAYLGSLAEHLCLVHDLHPPAWCLEPSRFLDRFWFPSPVKGFRAMAVAQSPAAFRRRGIFIAGNSLDRC